MRMEKHWYGLASYSQGAQAQEEAYARTLSGSLPSVLGFEFYPTITLGLRADLAADVAEGATCQIERVSRGGHATLHSPGQVVIYPIADLSMLNFRLREWVIFLQNLSLKVVQELGVESAAVHGESPGLFVGEKKLAFLGLHIRRGISTHGIALNVSNDLQLFSQIRSCGVMGQTHVSLKSLGISISCVEVFELWAEHFRCALLDRGPSD